MEIPLSLLEEVVFSLLSQVLEFKFQTHWSLLNPMSQRDSKSQKRVSNLTPNGDEGICSQNVLGFETVGVTNWGIRTYMNLCVFRSPAL